MSTECEIYHLRQENELRQKLLKEKEEQIQRLLQLLEQRQAPSSPAKKPPKPKTAKKPKTVDESDDDVEYLNNDEHDNAKIDTSNSTFWNN